MNGKPLSAVIADNGFQSHIREWSRGSPQASRYTV
jgi:hypothetical protein